MPGPGRSPNRRSRTSSNRSPFALLVVQGRVQTEAIGLDPLGLQRHRDCARGVGGLQERQAQPVIRLPPLDPVAGAVPWAAVAQG